VADDVKVVALGAHILDILGRPVTEIPEGQGGALIEEIRLSPAGAAGGTAVTLAKLGASVVSAGAVGTDDAGAVLVGALERFGVDCSRLVRRSEVQTSATILPIRPNGDRPALHVIGANGSYTIDDVPWEEIESASFLHVGGPEFLGPENATEILRRARAAGTVTTCDILADGWPELLDMLAPALQHVDYLFPNEDQALKLTGAEGDPLEAARALLDRSGAGCVAMTRGAAGSSLVTADGVVHVPAFEVEVVDTTGCGDAFVAGFIRGLSLGREPREAAVVGAATASLVATGLGSDAGEFDLDRVLEFAGSARALPLPG
jgi:sugar/nucleoside kinase (ribokinase family)